jgi:hypothetical protein
MFDLVRQRQYCTKAGPIRCLQVAMKTPVQLFNEYESLTRNSNLNCPTYYQKPVSHVSWTGTRHFL